MGSAALVVGPGVLCGVGSFWDVGGAILRSWEGLLQGLGGGVVRSRILLCFLS
jgi:hypothetical protein